MRNYGYIKDRRTRDNYILGGISKVPQEVLMPDGQWDDFLPDREYQNINNVETHNCTGFSASSVIEILFKKKYGLNVNYSDRALGILAGTYPPGNSLDKVCETIRRKGLEYETFMPFKDIHSVDEYYSPCPLPEPDKQRCLLWTDRYDFLYEWVNGNIESIKTALTFSPLQVALCGWVDRGDGVFYKPKGQEDNHAVVCYGYDDKRQVWKIWDSYDCVKKLYTYDSGIEFIKRYYIREKSIEEQNLNILQKFVNLLQNFYVYLIKQTYKVGNVVVEVFSKRN